MTPLFKKLLKARGVDEGFLSPKYENLNAPDTLPDMAKAVARIREAVARREKVLVFGDYDADGITAAAVLVRGLSFLGAEVSWDLPERTTDGYGLPARILETMPADTKLLITVDCGSRDLEIVKKLGERGVDVIITDHHEVGEVLPEAVAVVNPKREDSKYPFRELAGVGVAFQLIRAVASLATSLQRNSQGAGTPLALRAIHPASLSGSARPSDWTKWLLDLVAIGTVCDQVPLVADNRILAQYGLKVMAKSKWKGVRELIRDVKKLDAHALGFIVGPKINASGRLESPRRALELLLTDDAMTAAELAMQLNDLNQARKDEQRKALANLETTLGVKSGSTGVKNAEVLVVRGKWQEGLIGLIAGKLVEQHGKPAFVWTVCESADGDLDAGEAGGGAKMKCSARSFGEFSCAGAIAHLRELGLVEKGGGHAAAGGMSAAAADFEAIEKALCKYYRELKLVGQERFLREKPDVVVENVAELDLDFWKELQSLEPFGQGNPEPIFRVRGRLYEKRTMGKNAEHVCLKIGDGERRQFELCAWNEAKKWSGLGQLDEYEFDFKATYSDFGSEHLEGRVVDIARAGE
jgi:single-stranded-DNA-specific exonuclease